MDKEALKKKTVAELKEMAKALPDVKGISAMKKDELVELLASHTEKKDEPAKAPQAKAPQAKAPQAKAPQAKAPQAKAPQAKAPQAEAPQAKADIKERIRSLKAEKRDAISQQDKEKARRCNRQIHHYKRQLRKMAKEAK